MQTNFREIRDGLSNTIVVGEIAGRPDIYIRGKLDRTFHSPGNTSVNSSAWAISGSYSSLLFNLNPKVNESNNLAGLYSFHTSGANVAFADGAIRFLADSTDSQALHAMATRAGGEVVGSGGN